MGRMFVSDLFGQPFEPSHVELRKIRKIFIGKKSQAFSQFGFAHVIAGASERNCQLFTWAWDTITHAHRRSTSAVHITQFKTLLVYLVFMIIDVQNVITFLEYLMQKSISV